MTKNILTTTIIATSLGVTNANAVNVEQEVRSVVQVSKTDINRITCQSGQVTSIDYAAGTGLTHKTNIDKKNIIFLFKQLDNGISRKIIGSKVNMLISCDNKYYSLVLDPQDIDTQAIKLVAPSLETSAKKNLARLHKKSREQILVELIKEARVSVEVNTNNDYSQDIEINNLKIKLLNKKDIIGTSYQVNKFVVISNENKILDEKTFINPKITPYKIDAISIDEYQLNATKHTYLYLVVNKGEY